ncbi:MAG TPA: hypothetical protein VFV58_08670 [Blastocatellia bacterium]|jgi:hypothetical protein|nr:hypothetical protein [Blastocatellia bacterium]
MMNIASAFIANFSLRKLVNDKLHLPASYPGGASRGVGRAGLASPGQLLCHRSESFTCPVYASDYVSFDEQGFVASLRAAVEKEISDCAASITRQGDIEGDFNSSEFYFEYTQEENKGRIVISGKMVEGGYYLTAAIEEIAKGCEFPLGAERFIGAGQSRMCDVSGSVLPFAITEYGRNKPEGDCYIVLFGPDDPLGHDNKFRHIGFELLKESSNRIQQGVTKGEAGDLKYVEVWSLHNVLYFFNETALQMYRESGIELEALKKISSAEIPKGCNRILSGTYIPR